MGGFVFFFEGSVWFLLMFLCYLSFNLNSRLISRAAPNEDKGVAKKAFVTFPLSEFWLRYFFNKEITSKKIPIKYFEFNYIFTKRDCYVVNLMHCLKMLYIGL